MLIADYIDSAVSILDAEQELLRPDIQSSVYVNQPHRLSKELAEPTKSPLTLIPKFPNLGVMGMAEILTGLSLLGGIEHQTGKPLTTIDLSDPFERAFGFQYNSIYDRQLELFRRKPYNLTKTLDAMKAALLKEYKRRKAKKNSIDESK